MPGGFTTTIAGEWRAWRTAFKSLPDNPLAHYFALMRKRRLAKQSWSRRNAILIFGCICSLLVVLVSPLMYSSNFGISTTMGVLPSQYNYLSFNYVVGNLVLAGSTLVFFWILQSVYVSLYSALAFIGHFSGKDFSEGIDDLTGTSTMTDRQFVAVALSLSFVPIVKPIIAWVAVNQLGRVFQGISIRSAWGGGAANTGLVDATEYTPAGMHDELLVALLNLPVWKINLILMPLEVVYSLAASLLGAMLIVCMFIVLGRSLRHLNAIPIIALLTVCWMIFARFWILGGYTANGSISLIYASWRVALMITGCLVVPGLCLALLKFTMPRAPQSLGSQIISRLFFVPLLGLFAFGINLPEHLLECQTALGWGSMAFSPINPASTIIFANWDWYRTYPADFPWYELLRAPILIVTQLLTLACISPLILQAVAVRRQSQD